MMVGRLDVSVWNLALPLALAAGCGPQVGVADGDGDGDGSGTSVTATDTGTTGPGPQCNDSSDCGYGYECVAGHCEYECFCGCGSAPPPPENRFRCAEGGYYECYSDYGCDPNEECVGYVCMPRAECPSTAIELHTELSLSFAAGGPPRALAYAGSSSTLLVLQDTQVVGVDENGAVPWIDAGVPVSAMTAGFVDGDTDLDVVLAQSGETPVLQLWRGFAGGSFIASEPVELALEPQELALGDLQGDGAVDVVVRDAQGIWIAIGDGNGGLGAPSLLRAGGAAAMALLDADGDGVHDLAYADDGGFGLVWGSEQTHSMLSGAMVLDVIGLHAARFWRRRRARSTRRRRRRQPVRLARAGAHGGGAHRLRQRQRGVLGVVEVNLDGRDDLIRIDGDAMLQLSEGAAPDQVSEPPLSCDRFVQLPLLPSAIAVSASDRSLLATTDGSDVVIYRLVVPQ
ncbi:MAG: VCBS repeat-containing protein [Nannocystaceae bacterium]